MQAKRIVLGALVYFVILFVFNGVAQILPWGVPSAHSIRATSPETVESFGATKIREVAPGTLTTEQFDEEMVNKVSVLMTDKTFSWIVTKPLDAYHPGKYMAGEALTQLVVATLLTLMLGLTTSLPLRSRVILIAMCGVVSSVATYGQLFNWWGLTALYAIGVAANLVLAWVVGGLVVARFIIHSHQAESPEPRA